ncbi:MAG: DUF4922 domain-containing protein [Tannerellaceae bacterium]|jgi:hypothetical protein|nr:DUF4922 domain-containing protein [Tannerellaceae bacterium]
MPQEKNVEARQLDELLAGQVKSWPLLRDNYELFKQVRIKTVEIDGLPVTVQFNPSRIVSSGAKTDARSIRERKCFLCCGNRPAEQASVPFGEDYLILCNPFPIFPQHFTVSARQHTEQTIVGRLGDMLSLAEALDAYTVFYNGPQSGASAPDHMHFQLAVKNYMPIDTLDISRTKRIREGTDAGLYLLNRYLRNGWVIASGNKEEALRFFAQLCAAQDTPAGEAEPMMNIFCNYDKGQWILKVIPRKRHRPSQYFAVGEEQFLSSPGAADIGGVFITSREEDFRKATPRLLRSIYSQVCFDDDELTYIKVV